MSFPPELESTRVTQSPERLPGRQPAAAKLEWWERIERIVCASVALLLIAVPIVRLLLGVGGPLQLLFLPLGLWCIWQSLYEDRLDDPDSPTIPERLLATTWLWTRRLLLGSVGATFIVIAYLALSSDTNGAVVGGAAMLLLGVMSLWAAVYGAGRSRSTSDDREIHLKRKARYRW